MVQRVLFILQMARVTQNMADMTEEKWDLLAKSSPETLTWDVMWDSNIPLMRQYYTSANFAIRSSNLTSNLMLVFGWTRCGSTGGFL